MLKATISLQPQPGQIWFLDRFGLLEQTGHESELEGPFSMAENLDKLGLRNCLQ